MEKILRGKYLVRKGTLDNGDKILILTGMFFPINFDINEIKDEDEMWVSNLIVGSGVKFTDPIGSDGSSPEDFLDGQMTDPSCWKTKTKL